MGGEIDVRLSQVRREKKIESLKLSNFEIDFTEKYSNFLTLHSICSFQISP